MSTTTAPSAPVAQPARPGRRAPTWAVIGILSLCGTVVALQQTLVVPLLHDFSSIFGVSSDSSSWLVTATLLTSAVATPIVSRLADMFGKRLMMIVSMVTMLIGSVLAAAGGVFLTAIVGRSLQGFAAALIPIGISIMRDELPKEKVGSAVALMSATLGIGGALGLPLSGVIYQSLGWHAIFWISAGAAGLLIVGVLALVSESTVRTKGRFDFVGAGLLSVVLTSLLLAISKGSSWGWTSRPVLGLFVLMALALTVWVPYELRVGQPLVDLRTSGRRPVLLTNVASVLAGFAMFANLLLTTQQLQLPTATGYAFGLNVTVAGVASIPSGLAMVLMAPVSGRLINRYGGRVTLITGASIMGFAYLGRVFFSGTLAEVIAGSTMVGIGTAIAFAAMPTLIMSSVPITETASANGLNSLLRAVGTSLSSAAVAAVLGAVTIQVGASRLPSFNAFQDVYWMAGIAAFSSALVAAFVPAAKRATAVLTGAGENHEFVVSGSILRGDKRPAHPAVVTVMTIGGTQVDWARADSDGSYSVVLPGPGRYLVLANAQGWTPRAEVLEFQNPSARQHLTLTDQLTLSGTVTRKGAPIVGALVILTEATGEVVGSVTANGAGSYCMPLPGAGRYIVTALDPDTNLAHARKVVLDVRSAVVDIEAP